MYLNYLENENDAAAHQLFMDLYEKKLKRLEKKRS